MLRLAVELAASACAKCRGVLDRLVKVVQAGYREQPADAGVDVGVRGVERSLVVRDLSACDPAVFATTSPKDADRAGSPPWMASISTAATKPCAVQARQPTRGNAIKPSRLTRRDAERGEHLHEPDHGRALPVGGRAEQHDRRLMAIASPLMNGG